MTPLPSAERSSRPSLGFGDETPLAHELFAEARPMVARLLRAIRPDVTWQGAAARVSACNAGTSVRVTVIRYLDEESLGGSLDHVKLMAAARLWLRGRSFKIVLEEDHGDTETLIAGNDVVGFKIISNPSLFRVKASSRCFPRPDK